ncbi:hypothetical protein JCM8202v2_004879 [Rhodotorula sphaerocarpa]
MSYATLPSLDVGAQSGPRFAPVVSSPISYSNASFGSPRTLGFATQEGSLMGPRSAVHGNQALLYLTARTSSFSSAGSALSPVQSADARSPYFSTSPYSAGASLAPPNSMPTLPPFPQCGPPAHHRLTGTFREQPARAYGSSERGTPLFRAPTVPVQTSTFGPGKGGPLTASETPRPDFLRSPPASLASSDRTFIPARKEEPRKRKLVVRLPSASRASELDEKDNRRPLTATERDAVEAQIEKDADNFFQLELDEIASRCRHFDEERRVRLPETIDVYLPGRLAWEDVWDNLFEQNRWMSGSPELRRPDFLPAPKAKSFSRLIGHHQRSQSLWAQGSSLPPRMRDLAHREQRLHGHRLTRSMILDHSMLDFFGHQSARSESSLPTPTFEGAASQPIGSPPSTRSPLAATNALRGRQPTSDSFSSRGDPPVRDAFRDGLAIGCDTSQDGDAELSDEDSVGGSRPTPLASSQALPDPSTATASEGYMPFGIPGGPGSLAGSPTEQQRGPFGPASRTEDAFRPFSEAPMLNPDAPSFEPGRASILPSAPEEAPVPAGRRPLPPLPMPAVLPSPYGGLAPSPFEWRWVDSAPPQAPTEEVDRSSLSFDDPLPEQYAPPRLTARGRPSMPAVQASTAQPIASMTRSTGTSVTSPARMGDPRVAKPVGPRPAIDALLEPHADGKRGISPVVEPEGLRSDDETIISVDEEDLPLRILESLIIEHFERLRIELTTSTALDPEAICRALIPMLVKGFDAALEGVGIEKANFEQLATKLQILLDALQRGGTDQPDSPRSSTAGKLEASDATLVQASAQLSKIYSWFERAR